MDRFLKVKVLTYCLSRMAEFLFFGTMQMAMNQFGDLTAEEFRKYLGLRPLANGTFQ